MTTSPGAPMLAPMNIEITRGHGACFQRFTHETHGVRGFHLSAWLFAAEVTWDRHAYTLDAVASSGIGDGRAEVTYFGYVPICLIREQESIITDQDEDNLFDWRSPYFLDDILPNSRIVFHDHSNDDMEYVGDLIYQNWRTRRRV